MKHPTPSEPQADGLRTAYLDAVAKDRGPNMASSERILAYARQQAEQQQKQAATAQHGPDPGKPVASQASAQPAANDRQWRRHALGGMATLGLVAWLMLQTTWWSDGGDNAQPAPAAETVSSSADTSADRAASTLSAAAPPAPAPQSNRSASARRHDSLAEAKAKIETQAMPLPQEQPAANAAANELAPAPLPWCPDSTATDTQAAAKAGKALSASTTPPTCRPRPPKPPAQP